MDTSISHRNQNPAKPHLKAWNALTRWILHVPLLRTMADRQVCELHFAGIRSGKPITLPVMYAQQGDTIVILVGAPGTKLWWRNFAQIHPVSVWLHGVSRTGSGHAVGPGAPGRARAAGIYTAKFPDLPVENDPLVVITLDPYAANPSSRSE
ncbi:hypothetical protein Rhe02_59370 [Rhizocola hellebori]|uniref:Nitroreductase family deazaflavin-dependent oxidoreductase n=1 Tax=Rhizocola hellebori TaxID=1392758 RepID=A0A8J3VIR3_9ACTN|nr:hypothetical protein [Rhizocola hellebori]GIH07870.1 hypothetical protein Rhe02_59370 [Rhizocola hellebori]